MKIKWKELNNSNPTTSQKAFIALPCLETCIELSWVELSWVDDPRREHGTVFTLGVHSSSIPQKFIPIFIPFCSNQTTTAPRLFPSTTKGTEFSLQEILFPFWNNLFPFRAERGKNAVFLGLRLSFSFTIWWLSSWRCGTSALQEQEPWSMPAIRERNGGSWSSGQGRCRRKGCRRGNESMRDLFIIVKKPEKSLSRKWSRPCRCIRRRSGDRGSLCEVLLELGHELLDHVELRGFLPLVSLAVVRNDLVTSSPEIAQFAFSQLMSEKAPSWTTTTQENKRKKVLTPSSNPSRSKWWSALTQEPISQSARRWRVPLSFLAIPCRKE